MTRRHLLVIAPQCRTRDRLVRLEGASRALHEVLASDLLGGCVAGLPDGSSLLYGELSSEGIRAKVNEAIRHAGAERATLVLALLGHGFTPGDAPTLYLMGWDAVEGDRLSAVDVVALLRDAADQAGVEGVIGIVDTCHAASAQPYTQELAIGSRAGQTRLSLIMASSATERAFDLRLSHDLAALLREGLDEAGPVLRMAEVVDKLRLRITGQTITTFGYDGDPFAESALWLARNAKHATEPAEGLLGPMGRAELGTAVQSLDPGHPSLQGSWDVETLRNLRRELASPGGYSQRERARRAVVNAQIAQETVKFLRSRLRHQLSTDRLRRALASLWAAEGLLSPVPQQPTVVDAVDLVAFRYPASHRDCRAWIAKFVWLLANAAGIDEQDEGLWQWAGSIDAELQIVDATEFFEEIHKGQHLRLVISLPSLAGDWPDALDAWLYRDSTLHEHYYSPCQSVDQAGTEDALRDVLARAHQAAQNLDLQLRRVDIAAPTALLLGWRPEQVEIGVGGEYLGVNHEVVAHWDQRLSPPRTLWWILQAASDRLQQIANSASGTPLDWLAEHDTRELGDLQKRLQMGQYMRGIGLQQHPGTDTELMDLLFCYIPIVIWPQIGTGFPPERQSCLDHHWGSLPVGFLTAYRLKWQDKDAEAGDLADLRAVWDDREWLDFCRKVAPPPIKESGSTS